MAKLGAVGRMGISRRRLATALVVLLPACACSDTLPPENTKPVTAIVGAKLIDGSDSEPVEDTVILIEGTRILTVGPRSHTPVPKGGEIVDGSGKVVIPGLVDAHVHYFGDREEMERAFRAQLYFGVTTVRSLGADTDEHLATIQDLKAGRIPGPRIYTAGRGFLHPEGDPRNDPIPRRPAAQDEAREHVRELAAQDVDFIKIWVDSHYGDAPKITPDVRQAIVDEAAKQRIPVVAHAWEEEDVYQLGRLGVTDFLHTIRDQGQLDPQFLGFVKEHGISFTPTLAILESRWRWSENPDALKDPEARFGINTAALADAAKGVSGPGARKNPEVAKWKEELARAKRVVNQMSDAGVPLLVGSDSGAGLNPSGWGTHREMALLVEAGLSPGDVIRMATVRAARRLSQGDVEYGVIEAGKIADLILLDGDPLAAIENTRKIGRVMQAGKWLDRRELVVP